MSKPIRLSFMASFFEKRKHVKSISAISSQIKIVLVSKVCSLENIVEERSIVIKNNDEKYKYLTVCL